MRFLNFMKLEAEDKCLAQTEDLSDVFLSTKD